MPITYDSGTNTITVVGGSETSPYSFEDIYQADVNGGWGVVSKQDDIQYTVDAKLRIGDGSTETWFKDTNKHIIITPAANDAFYVANNAVFQLGEKDANGNPYNGCDFRVPNYEGDSAFYGCDNGAWRLYDCIIYYPTFLYLWSRGVVPPTHEIIGCRFIKFMGMRVAGESSIIDDCVLHSDSETWSMIGLTFKGQLAEVSNIYSYKLMYGVYWSPQYGLSDAIITGLKVRKCQYAVRVYGEYGDYTMYLIDADIDNWNIKWENMSTDANKIYRQYTFKVRVTDKDGNPISGAVVEVWDKNNNKVVTAMTDSNGDITPQIVTYGYYAYPSGNAINSFSPHLIRITKSGYKTIEFELTINRTIDMIVPLNAETTSIDDVMQELQNHRNTVEPNIDAKISSRSSHSPADVWNYSNRELTNPDNYKADVSDLAKESTVQEIKAKTDKLQFNTDNDVKATLDGEKVDLLDSIKDQIKRILGLTQENFKITDQMYENGHLVQATIKIYESKDDLENDQNPIAVYTMHASFDGDQCTEYRVVKET